jgi:FkbM family methyltransferase
MSLLNNDDIFVDVGSNIGLFSLIASKYVGANGKVICFEPDPVSFRRLAENISMNNFDNLDIRNMGLSNEQGELEFHIYNNGHDAWNSFARDEELNSDNSITVSVSSLDHELENIDKNRIKVIKIDVEGWEKFVLIGGQNFFKEFDPVVLMEFTDVNAFNAGYGIHELFDIMTNWGYVWYRLEKNNTLKQEIKQFRYPFVNLIAIKPKDYQKHSAN